MTELHATNGRKQLPKTGGDKTRKLAYIQHLERLTAVQTSGSPDSRIRRLRNVAEELNIPRYKWDPSPVKRYFDPSIIRSRDPAARLIDPQTGEFLWLVDD